MKAEKLLYKATFAGLSALSLLIQAMPERVMYPFAEVFASVLRRALKLTKHRDFIRGNILAAYGKEITADGAGRLEEKHLKLFMKSLAEFLRYPRILSEGILNKVRAENYDIFEKALGEGRGCLVLSAHFGNWEFLASYLSARGNKVYAVVQQSDDAFNDFMINYRKMSGWMPLRRWKSLKELVEIFKRGEVLAMLGDQHGEFQKVFASFFGHSVSVHAGPAVFHIRMGVPVVMAFVIREPGDGHRIEFAGPVTVELTGDEQADIEAFSQKYMSIYEDYIRKYPDHWLWSYNRWDKIKMPHFTAAHRNKEEL